MTGSPWENDIAGTFTDPAVAAQVDQFLREKVQPYVTSVEERAALAGDVQQFWDQWSEDPSTTWFEMTKELVGDDQAQKILAVVNDAPQEEAAPVTEETPAPPIVGEAPAATPYTPEQQEALDALVRQRQIDKYDAAVNEFIAANPDAQVKRELFDPFVSAAGGQLDTALANYTAWAEQARTEFGGETPPPPEGEPAPPALNGETGGVTAPPTTKDYGGNIDAAVDDFFNEQRASAPPVVGAAV